MERELLFEAKKLTKHFGPTVALDNVDFKVYRGEITGLIGETVPVNPPSHPLQQACSLQPAEKCFLKAGRTNRRP